MGGDVGSGAEEAVRAFLGAFERLDADAFGAAFDDDACCFFPATPTAERVEGRAAVLARFAEVFAVARRERPGGPPFLDLRPEGLRADVVGPGVAIVTFTLRNTERIGRRTLVLVRRGAGWRILHLHASNVAATPPPAPP